MTLKGTVTSNDVLTSGDFVAPVGKNDVAAAEVKSILVCHSNSLFKIPIINCLVLIEPLNS